MPAIRPVSTNFVSPDDEDRALRSLIARLEASGYPLEKPQGPGILEKALDLLGRPLNTVTGGIHAGLNNESILGGAWKGLTGDTHISTRNILENDLGVENTTIPFFPDTNTMLGFAGDMLLDPLTYLTLGSGSGLKQIGKAGAKKLLTKGGEEALMSRTLGLIEKGKGLENFKTGAIGLEDLAKSSGKLAENQMLETFGTPAGKRLFDRGGVKLFGKTLVPGDTIKNTAVDLLNTAKKVPFAGRVVDVGQNAADYMKDVTGHIFKPGYEFTKEIKDLNLNQQAIARNMGLSPEEAKKVFPEISSEVQGFLNDVSKSKRFATEQSFKTMLDTFSSINPEEGKALTNALEGSKEAYDMLSEHGKTTADGLKTMLKNIGEEQMDYGFTSRMVDNFSPRFLSEESRQFVRDNATEPNKAIQGLIQVFSPSKNKERVLIDTQTKNALIERATGAAEKRAIERKFTNTFMGVELKNNTIEEVNKIAKEKLGFNWFEDDIVKALPRYYAKFMQNKSLMEGLSTLPEMVNSESGYNIFRKLIDTGGEVMPGYSVFKETSPLKGYQAPKFIADQVDQTYKILTNDQGINKFLKQYDSALSKFKMGVTLPFPVFHTQNFMGGQFNNYLYGLTPGSPTYLKRMGQATSAVLGKNMAEDIGEGAMKGKTLEDVMNLYKQFGVSQGLYHGDVGESVYKKVFSHQEPMIRKGITKATDALTNVGGVVEDVNRLPVFINELIKHGDPRRAAKETLRIHFDYSPEAYTTMEREVFQRLVPFYKFMRGNIPLQLSSVYHQPGRVNAVVKAVNALGGGEDVDKPEWLRRKFSIKLPPEAAQLFGKNPGEKVFMTLPFPLEDIGKLDNRTLLTQVTPFLKIPLEYMTNQNLFFGNHIYNPDLPSYAQTSKAYPFIKPLTQIPGIGPQIAKFINWTEKPVKDAQTGQETGDVYYEADSKKMYFLKTALGPVSRAFAMFGDVGDQTTAATLSESMLPMGLVPVDPFEEKVKRIKSSKRELSELVGYLKARGLIPEAKRRKAGEVAPVGAEGQDYLDQYIGE